MLTVDIRTMVVPLHGAAAMSWRPLGLPTNFWWSLCYQRRTFS